MPIDHRSQAAFTKNDHPYPGYINATREDDVIVVTVRGDARHDGQEGPLATLKLTRSDWLSFHMNAGFRL